MALNSNKHSVCVIIPMYNEERGAKRCVHAVVSVLQNIKIPSSLLVVDDGSKDTTLKILQRLKKLYKEKLVIISHGQNKGYGAGLATGVREAIKQGYEYCIFMDSDLTNSPNFIPQFVDQIDNGYDCVKASRYIKGGGMVGVPLMRKMYSGLGNMVASILFDIGIHDCSNGFRMVRLEMLKDVKYQEKGFSIILEELYDLKKKNAHFKEIPNILTNRTIGKTSFSYTPQMLWDYAKYAIKAAFI